MGWKEDDSMGIDKRAVAESMDLFDRRGCLSKKALSDLEFAGETQGTSSKGSEGR
jgi:hypothetical protein